MIKLVLIDFDDTLCLTEKACFRIENYVAQKMGFAPMTPDAHIKNWGKPLQIAIEERIPGIDGEVFMEEIEKTLPAFIQRGELDAITDINITTLQKLRKNGIKTAILTSRSLMEVKHLLVDDHPLNAVIDAFYHKENTDFLKPDPRVFDKILQHFSVSPKEAVYVGDSITDGICTKGAGMHFIALLESELKTKEDFKEISVDFFAKKFEDILSYIQSR